MSRVYRNHAIGPRLAAALSGVALISVFGGLSACSKSQTDNAQDTIASAAADVSAGVSSVAADMDAQKTSDFVTKAAIANMFEIQTSEAAIKTSKNPAVLSFAKMMVKDHTAAGKAFETAVGPSGLTPPTMLDDDHQNKLNDLTTKTGKDFDDQYISLQKDAHSDAVSLFDDYSKNGKDASLAKFATDTLPTLQKHKDAIDKM